MTDDKVKQLLEEKSKFILMNQNNNMSDNNVLPDIKLKNDKADNDQSTVTSKTDDNIQIWL